MQNQLHGLIQEQVNAKYFYCYVFECVLKLSIPFNFSLGRASLMPSSTAGIDKTESTGNTGTRRSSAVSNTTEDELGPLPEGWEERLHSDGRIFFIDHSY